MRVGWVSVRNGPERRLKWALASKVGLVAQISINGPYCLVFVAQEMLK